MSADEAKDYGIIDTVISSQHEIVSEQVIKAQAENRA
jgi:ATP-dependent protease ClpP protease subunit